MALVGDSMMFLAQWAGFRGKFQPIGEARDLSEIWWHLPAFVFGLATALMLWPWRIDPWDDI